VGEFEKVGELKRMMGKMWQDGGGSVSCNARWG